MKKRNKRWIGWLVLGLILLVCAAAVIIVILRINRRANEQWRDQYRMAAVESIVFAETVEITGNLRPIDARDLSFPVGGRVTAVPVEVGSPLDRGSVVARLDDGKARYELTAIEAQLQQKKLSGASREIQILELQREIAAQAVRDHVLRSPIDGRISELNIRVDDYVAAGRRVARVIDDSSFKATVQIDELDSPRVRAGQPVRFFFDALTDLEVKGSVLSLAIEARVTSNGLAVRDGEVLIEDPPAELLSGYSFTGQILLGREEQVLAVPQEAVFNQGGETFLLLPPENGGAPERRIVEARVLDSERIQILSGVTDGQEIL
ncbi:MAG: HlyD family efflux transporter periplasmic adaptor subunit, partial [Spirochaetales bacterium]|nr:HlyD family efflux transporter periplasmic adaptor subunit [Spirochaetales bacterium]